MKAVILAGGLGTRISEESDHRPKPMVEIGGRPILWHIMDSYSKHGITDFVICLGYKGYQIKEFFLNYRNLMSDLIINLEGGNVTNLSTKSENWTITLVDTGLETQTGGRIKRVQQYVGGETFCLTYGDGVSDIDITQEIEAHRKAGLWATVAAVRPPGRFATLKIDSSRQVLKFREKPEDEVGWINGGFFVLEPEIFSLIEGDETQFEREPLAALADSKQLFAYQHVGFWKSMDTLGDKRELERILKVRGSLS